MKHPEKLCAAGLYCGNLHIDTCVADWTVVLIDIQANMQPVILSSELQQQYQKYRTVCRLAMQ